MKKFLLPRSMGCQGGFSLLEAAFSIAIIGMGIFLFTKTQGTTRKAGYSNAKLLLAGNLIKQHVENMRIAIAQDTNANWPPASGVTEQDHGITLVRSVSPALSPRDGATLPLVRKVHIVTSWGNTPPTSLDTLRITTYVSKRF